MRKIHVNSTVFSLIVSLFILTSAQAAQHCDNWMARVVSVQGAVQAKNRGRPDGQLSILTIHTALAIRFVLGQSAGPPSCFKTNPCSEWIRIRLSPW